MIITSNFTIVSTEFVEVRAAGARGPGTCWPEMLWPARGLQVDLNSESLSRYPPGRLEDSNHWQAAMASAAAIAGAILVMIPMPVTVCRVSGESVILCMLKFPSNRVIFSGQNVLFKFKFIQITMIE
jgi:hypothetical protein